VQLVRLRKKLAQAGAPAPTIKCIRGAGYQLCVSLEIRQLF
jgi:DNA-binding response OmpR family regulator